MLAQLATKTATKESSGKKFFGKNGELMSTHACLLPAAVCQAGVIRDNQFGTVDAKRFIKNFVREVVGEKDLACIVCVCVKQAVK